MFYQKVINTQNSHAGVNGQICSLFAGDKLVPFWALELVIGDIVMKTIRTKDSVNPITPFLEIVHVQLFHRAVVILVCGHHRKIKGGAVDS